MSRSHFQRRSESDDESPKLSPISSRTESSKSSDSSSSESSSSSSDSASSESENSSASEAEDEGEDQTEDEERRIKRLLDLVDMEDLEAWHRLRYGYCHYAYTTVNFNRAAELDTNVFESVDVTLMSLVRNKSPAYSLELNVIIQKYVILNLPKLQEW
jgi:cytoskeletal protein RodZ